MSAFHSLRRQITGAMLGAVLAYGCYAVGHAGFRTVRAYLLPPGYSGTELPSDGVRLSNAEPSTHAERLTVRAQEAVERMQIAQTTDAEQSRLAARLARPPLVVPASSSSSSSAMTQTASVARKPSTAVRAGSLPQSGPAAAVIAIGAVAGGIALRRRTLHSSHALR